MDIPTRLAALLVASALTVAAQAAPRYRFEAIASPTGTQLWRNGDLNDAGQVAAVWYTPQGDATWQIQAALYTPGLGQVAIGPVSTDELAVYGLNASGAVVGAVGDSDAMRAWRFSPTAAPIGGAAAGVRSAAMAINDAGATVGFHARPDGLPRPWIASPGGTPQPLASLDEGAAIGINNRGEVLYAGPGGPGFPIYRVDPATGTVTPVGNSAVDTISAARLNDEGDIAVTFGWRFTGAGVFHADGSFTQLAGLPGYADQQSFDLNDRGQVLGASYNAGPGIPFDSRPFVYTPGVGTVDPLALTDVPDGWTGLALTRLNNHGDILGSGYFGDDARVFLLRNVATPVPEPGTLAMLGWGLFAVGCAGRAARRGRSGGAGPG